MPGGRLRADSSRSVDGQRTALDGIEFIGFFPSREDLLEASFTPAPDVVVLEFPTIHDEQVREVARLFAHSGAARAIVVYGFASRATLARLDSIRMVLCRAPFDLAELRHWCLAMGARVSAEVANAVDIDVGAPLAARRFTDADLARIATASPSMLCECPRHLADLVSELATFETYSEECEIRHVDDAALHAYLLRCAARARELMEAALARVIVADGFDLDRKD